jgi:riboflavin synthase
MFTGIVQGLAELKEVMDRGDVTSFRLVFPPHALEGVVVGASISLAGCCLTVTSFTDREATFDLVPETLSRTLLGRLPVGGVVNFERSLRFGDEVGGHILSGHVDAVATIKSIETLGESRVVTFSIAPQWTKYLFEKGYVALNGASLTLTRVDKTSGDFCVSLIPETLAKTTFGAAREGDPINVEIDRTTQVIVDTVERITLSKMLPLSQSAG